MEISCKTCANSINGSPDCSAELCANCCRCSNWVSVMDQFNDDYEKEE